MNQHHNMDQPIGIVSAILSILLAQATGFFTPNFSGKVGALTGDLLHAGAIAVVGAACGWFTSKILSFISKKIKNRKHKNPYR